MIVLLVVTMVRGAARASRSRDSDTIRYVNATLPPGPTTSRLLQTVRWIYRPGPMLEDCRRRYGDMFTLRIAHEGTWVFLADPDAVKQVFTGDPRVLHAGEANVVLLPHARATTPCCCSTRPPTCPSAS